MSMWKVLPLLPRPNPRRRQYASAVDHSEVLRTGRLSRASAQISASSQRYSARLDHFRKGGPPPREAIVAIVFGRIGNPAVVNAAANCSRVNKASLFGGNPFSGLTPVSGVFICAHHQYCNQSRWIVMLLL